MKKFLVVTVMLALILSFGISNRTNAASSNAPRVGIAWRADVDVEFFRDMCRAIEAAGGKWVIPDQVRSADLSYDANGHLTNGVNKLGALTPESAKLVRCNSWHGSNVTKVVQNVDIVFFPGGEDISPTLLYKPEKWHGIPAEISYNAERDVSDYLTMSYCLDNDIPVFAVCRGMQMLSVVSGAEIIKDLPAHYAESGVQCNFEHRNEPKSANAYRDYAPNNITIQKDSLLYRLVGSETWRGVPCWHHQALANVDNTRLEVVGYTYTNGIQIIEAVERKDKTFALGFQFHPEAALIKHIDNAKNKTKYIDYDTVLKLFRGIIGRQFNK